MANIEDIAAQALTLEMKDRAKLVERLLLSLDELSDAEIDVLHRNEGSAGGKVRPASPPNRG